MSQPPYGVPPQQGHPQGYPQQPPQPGYGQPGQAAAPPPYLGGPASAGGYPAAAPGGFGPGLPPPPPSKPRHVGLVVGLITTFLLLGFVALVAIISLTN
ncbi:hypothetical protein [Nocardioides vastitatis]|uniref:DUF4190 domain-containing protein n=1 Tax=Nocardioides vastitatis TaxID=2568655 RepID=A0ABW0ZGX9_9ACTN